MLLTNGTQYYIHHGDCIEHIATMPEASVDFSVFSPPFPTLYAYTSKPEDIGNSENLRGEAKLHLGFFYRQLARVVKPGRVVCVHVMQIPRLKRTGEVGLCDFRGMNIRIGERSGLVYEYDWMVRKNPQAQAIRTHSHELQFAGLERDRARTRGTLCDYVIKFRAPGENQIPIIDDGNYKHVSRNDWIEQAEGFWTDIKETDTLNVSEGRGADDTKHICPLQLGLIRRLIRLYTNPCEIVFSPFAGIGSEGFEAIKEGRKFYGCEIKDEYVATAKVNMERAIKIHSQSNRMLFNLVESI